MYPWNVESTQTDEYLSRMYEESRRTYGIPGLSKFTFGKKHELALDLGMNVGTFSLVYAKKFTKIIAVEASSVCISDALENFKNDEANNIQIIHAALASKSDEFVELRRVYVGESFESKDFTTATWDSEELSKSSYPGRIAEAEEVVTSISWNDLLARHNIRKIDFVKCDIEGAEFELFIHQDVSAIGCLVMELHYTALGPERTRMLVKHLNKQLDFYFPQQTNSFLNQWPPPGILRMINPSNKTNWTWLARSAYPAINIGRRIKRALPF